MVKPIDLDELVLRINALVRRANIAFQKRLTIGSLVLDEDETSATIDYSDEELLDLVRQWPGSRIDKAHHYNIGW